MRHPAESASDVSVSRSARRARSLYGSGIVPAVEVVDADVDDLGVEDLAGSCRRPGRTSTACRGSAARPSWTLLMIASSAARSLVSVSRRFVSSNSRAFSSATLRLEASVVSSRTSDSLNASLAIEVLERDHAPDLAADDERREERPTCAGSPWIDCAGWPEPRRHSADVSLMTSGCAGLERRCVRNADDRRSARPGSARRARSCTGSGSTSGARSRRCRCRRPGRRRSRWILSPTRSYIDCMSSFAARPSWTLLMIASSAARSLVSVSSRLRLVEQARVLERDAQARGERGQQPHVRVAERVGAIDVLEARSVPRTSSLTISGTKSIDLVGSPSDDRGSRFRCSASHAATSLISSGLRVSMTVRDRSAESAIASHRRRAHAALDRVRVVTSVPARWS